MYAVSPLFNTYSSGDREFEIKAIINGTTYDNTEIVSFEINEGCVTGEEFTLGTVITSTLVLNLITSNTIAANSKIEPFVRMNGDSGYTEWVPLGAYYIDKRIQKNGVWTFTCYDRLIYAEQEYSSDLTFPESMQNVFDEICTQLSLAVDSSVAIDPSYEMPYKPEGLYTIREMLSFIASANGASVGLTKDEKIRFIKFAGASTAITAADFVTCQQTNPVKTYTKILLTYNTDGETLETGIGDADHTLNLYNPFIDETMLNSLLTSITGLSYAPISMEWKGLPQIEPGDPLRITLRDSSVLNTFVLTNKSVYKGGLNSTITAPSISSQQSEFSFQGGLSRQVKNSVKTTETYYGVTIGRAKGLSIKRSDGVSETTINSDVWEVLINGAQMLYADYLAGKLIFNGELSADVINALKAQIDVVISNTIITQNLYAARGTIAELTVDQLDTSDKVYNFLHNIKDAVNYIKTFDQHIQFITATYAGDISGQINKIQLTDRNGRPLYWVDEQSVGTATTYNITSFPVYVYVYTEMTKLDIAFENIDGVKTPIITWGAGANVGGHPDYGKGFTYKGADGLHSKYITSAGVIQDVLNGESGIIQIGNTGAVGLRNIAVGSTAPESPQLNDLWIDTDV